MLNFKYLIFFSIILLFKVNNCSIVAQNTDSIGTDSMLAKSIYDLKFRNELGYINGREYKPYHLPQNENPYLESMSGVGNIYVQGNSYTNKKIRYDINKDILVVNPDYLMLLHVYIQLNPTVVDSFSINVNNKNYTFINYKEKDCFDSLKPGYYQQVYKKNKNELLIKHLVIPGSKNGITTYEYVQRRYVFLNNKFYNISKKKQLLSLYPNSKKELNKMIKAVHPSYKKMSVIQLIQVIKFTETL